MLATFHERLLESTKVIQEVIKKSLEENFLIITSIQKAESH